MTRVVNRVREAENATFRKRKRIMSSFLTDEQRLVLEKALGDKRRDEELREADGKDKEKAPKPSVLDIDPWESGGLMFLRRPSFQEGSGGERRGSHHEDSTLSGKQNLHLYNAKAASSGKEQPDTGNYVPVTYSQSSHAQGGGSGHHAHHSKGHNKNNNKKSIRSKGFWKGLVSLPGDNKHYLDEKDPNYDPEEEASYYEYNVYSQSERTTGAQDELKDMNAEQKFKFKLVEDLQEYLSSGDMVDFKTSVEEMCQPQMHHLLVKRAILLALDRSQREREMISQLFSFLYPKVLDAKQMLEGFENVLDCVDDILLDHPQAVEMLSLFIARAVIDDILPPSFVQKIRAKKHLAANNENGSTNGASEAAAAVDMNNDEVKNMERILVCVDGHINSRHATERLLRCWGSGAGRDIDATKSSMHGLLSEYIMSEDVVEASHCLSSLKVPFFHHECVKQAIVMMLEEPKIQAKLMALLSGFARTGLVSDHQMSTGFFRVQQRLPDLQLDIPQASGRFADVSSQAVSSGLLSEPIAAANGNKEKGTQEEILGASPAAEVGSKGQVDEGFLKFKEATSNILSEYFSSGDVAEAIARMKELDTSSHHAWFVKRAFTSAMDRRPRDKEMLCVLLSDMYNDFLHVPPMFQRHYGPPE